MPRISSFGLQYNNVNFSQMLNSPYDLIITEGDPLPPPDSVPAMTDSQVMQLQAQGRTLVGYVETSVTEDYRSYWDPSWTDDGTDHGNLTASAPSWLQGQPRNQYGYIVKYWDPAWHQIVISEALDLVNRGYNGVFLDDVGRYYDLGQQPGAPSEAKLAARMIDLVADVTNAIRAVNPNAYVVVNGDPYIVTDTTGGLNGSEAHKFFNSIDAMLLEDETKGAINDAIHNTAPHATLLALFAEGSAAHKQSEAMQAYKDGIVPYVSQDQAYNKLGAFVNPGTSGNDHLNGGNGPNQLNGLSGNDAIHGYNGDDELTGGKGSDVLNGSAGADALNGGPGADRFVYSAASDSFAASFDTITGFAAGTDKIGMPFKIASVDAKITIGRLSQSHFAADIQDAVGRLGTHHAVVFAPGKGTYAGETFLIIDANGHAGFQALDDMVIRLNDAHNVAALAKADFA